MPNPPPHSSPETMSPMPGMTYSAATGLAIDWKLYSHYLDDSDLSDDQKRDFIETLASIMFAFVDLGLDLHPLQQVPHDGSDNKKRQDAKRAVPAGTTSKAINDALASAFDKQSHSAPEMKPEPDATIATCEGAS